MMEPAGASVCVDTPAAPVSSGGADIPIANIYYLLCYAWDVLEEKETLADVDALDSTDLLNLFARVLANGTRRLLRRGLDRGYLPREDEIPGVRGKLLVTQTLRRNLLRHGRAACAWDELEYDTLPNRILKTTLQRLHDAEELDPSTRADVHDLLRWLAPVRNIELTAEHFRRVQLHRNNRIYAFLLHICEFVHEHWLPAEHGGARRFRDFVRDGLSELFENFVFNFYRHELSTGWQVSAPFIQWQLVAPNADALALVPRMETDVCLRGPGRAIILDTKFYAQALKTGSYGSPKLSSPNLYQIFTYLRQQSCEPGWEQAEGVLLYPRTTRDFAVEFTTPGHRIRALTLDLTKSWQNIHAALMQIVAAEPPMSAVAKASSPAAILLAQSALPLVVIELKKPGGPWLVEG
jgi:5-methylcytosine-specific restriction enzyme subunit McrC